jgi:outer membrane protein assembly factor BamA
VPANSFKYLNSFKIQSLLLLVLVLSFLPSKAQQQNHYIIIDSIRIEGNSHSEKFVIERELLFKYDSIYESDDLNEMAINSHNLLMNTNLFITASVKWTEFKPKHVAITVNVREKWYHWPIPIFELADRNYNQWSQMDYDLNRTNYGLHYNLYNFRGRNETIKLRFINGYTRDYGIEYILPFSDKSGKYGLEVSTSFKQNKEIWYLTQNNKLQFYKNFEKTLIQRFENMAAFTTRRNNFSSESWSVLYNHISVADTIHSKDINPNFLLGKQKQREIYIRHIFNFEKRDNKYYPLTGFYFKNTLSLGSIRGDTASIELVKETVEGGIYKEIKKRLYLSGFMKLSLTNQPLPFIPYNNFKAFGYDDYVRGYEQYVIDGHAFALAKANLRYALLHQYMLRTPIKVKKQKYILPVGIYLNTYCDWGKAFNEQWVNTLYNSKNNLIKSDLIGYGAGIDLLFLNDKLLRFEYSLNRLGDKNFNLHFKKPF